MFSPILLLSLVGAVAAIPTKGGGGNTCSATSQIAKFDDLGSTLPAVGGLLSKVPMGYDGLNWQAFHATSIGGPTNVIALIPHSPNNAAFTTNTIQATEGSPILSVNYQSSPVSSFSLQNLCYGCVLDIYNNAVAPPTECFITLTGYVGGDGQGNLGTQKCAQELHYDPTTLAGSQQMACTEGLLAAKRLDPTCFADVTSVRVAYSQKGGEDVLHQLLAVAFDDVQYTTKSKTC